MSGDLKLKNDKLTTYRSVTLSYILVIHDRCYCSVILITWLYLLQTGDHIYTREGHLKGKAAYRFTVKGQSNVQ